jgi:hypothetical protein
LFEQLGVVAHGPDRAEVAGRGRDATPKSLQSLAIHVIPRGVTPGEHLIVDETLKVGGAGVWS